MPDFFTHVLTGVIVSSIMGKVEPIDLLLAIVLSTLPDIDAFMPPHRALLHSLIVVIPISLVSFALLQGIYGGYSIVVSLLPLIHILLDALTGGIPVRLFYPLSKRSYQLSNIVDRFIVKLLKMSPYGYYIEVIRVNMILTLLATLLILYRYLTAT
ncbi:MAG TPA: metal-dependent hydrolase [Thermoprotei archaeon]|nr:metal-dependent hydrolase [Thermoprotei archaeon]